MVYTFAGLLLVVALAIAVQFLVLNYRISFLKKVLTVNHFASMVRIRAILNKLDVTREEVELATHEIEEASDEAWWKQFPDWYWDVTGERFRSVQEVRDQRRKAGLQPTTEERP